MEDRHGSASKVLMTKSSPCGEPPCQRHTGPSGKELRLDMSAADTPIGTPGMLSTEVTSLLANKIKSLKHLVTGLKRANPASPTYGGYCTPQHLYFSRAGKTPTTCLWPRRFQIRAGRNLALLTTVSGMSSDLSAPTRSCLKSAASFPFGRPKLGDDHLLDLGVLATVSETSLTRDTAFSGTKRAAQYLSCPGGNLLVFEHWLLPWPTARPAGAGRPASA